MNIYEFNKGIYANIPPMNDSDVKSVFREYFYDNRAKFYLMLNHDIHYYTVFHNPYKKIDNMILETLSIAKELGEIVDTLINEDNGMLEIWIRQDNEILMFGLFNYERGIVEV